MYQFSLVPLIDRLTSHAGRGVDLYFIVKLILAQVWNQIVTNSQQNKVRLQNLISAASTIFSLQNLQLLQTCYIFMRKNESYESIYHETYFSQI